MGSLEKLSEAIAVFGLKKEGNEDMMKQMMLEWASVEQNSRTMRDLSARAVSELESKQKHSKEVVESVQASYALLNSKKRLLEEGLEKLEGKVQFVRGVLEKVEVEKVQSRAMRDFMDQQLALRENQIQHLSEPLKLAMGDVEKRKIELDLMEKVLNGRKEEMDSRLKQLEARELEMLEKMQQEVDAKKKRLVGELESTKASLVEQESLIASKERTLAERGTEFAQKQKFWEVELEAKKASLAERENLMQSKAMKDPREHAIQQPDSCTITISPPGILMEGNRRGFGDGSSGEDLAMDSQRRAAKRRRCGEGVTELIKPRRHSQQSVSKDKLKAKTSEDIRFLDDSESVPDMRGGLVLKDARKWELVRHFNVGQTWACFDVNDDRMPRTYVQILGIAEKDGKVCLQVEWMKPFPRHAGEKEWIRAGLPVGCGTFEPSTESVEDPRILFQPIITAGNPYIIVPFIGETWAIYKDWDVKKWCSRPDKYRGCRYEIVEILRDILPYASLSAAVRVVGLKKVRGSACSFQRRTKKGDSFLVLPNSLYRFSHKVPSLSKNSGVFELDQSALPPGL